MILLFTDFGHQGPYLGELQVAIEAACPAARVIDLQHDAPNCNPRSACYLLAALVPRLPPDAVVLAVVDPGVGSGRDALVLRADGRWFVGPDNGLFDGVLRGADGPQCWSIRWRPETLSFSFHGRDLFAPVAGWLATRPADLTTRLASRELPAPLNPEALAEVIYIDHYGNAFTGLSGDAVEDRACLFVNRQRLEFAATFSSVPELTPFWYRNAGGLVEIAVNRGSAAERLGLRIGTTIEFG